jgi:hypothetical protein
MAKQSTLLVETSIITMAVNAKHPIVSNAIPGNVPWPFVICQLLARMELNNYLQSIHGGSESLSWEITTSGSPSTVRWTASAFSKYNKSCMGVGVDRD